MSKNRIFYDDNENLPSPTKELRDVPFSRVSKTIVKVPELIDSGTLSTSTRHRSDIFSVDELASSPNIRDKKPENSVKKG
ncbi:11333_t:CDS:2, partial [Racocetra persica]